MALGLAERVAELANGSVEQRDIPVGRVAALAPPALWGLVPAHLVLQQGGPSLRPPWPDLVIGAGRKAAPFVAALRNLGVKSVQILDPQMNPARFDLVIAPEHDGLDAANVIPTLGSVNRITPGLLDEARRKLEPNLAGIRRPFVAVLIGGATRRTALTANSLDMLANDLRVLSAQNDLVVTTSRRTGEDNMATLRRALPDVWFWDGTGDNPYFGMLACADAIVVTDDSVNMASEAAAAGKPLAIYPLLQEKGKIARFHEALIERGHAERFRGAIPTAAAAPLDETGRAAEAVLALLREQGSRAPS